VYHENYFTLAKLLGQLDIKKRYGVMARIGHNSRITKLLRHLDMEKRYEVSNWIRYRKELRSYLDR
jgi:hypothetical protein